MWTYFWSFRNIYGSSIIETSVEPNLGHHPKLSKLVFHSRLDHGHPHCVQGHWEINCVGQHNLLAFLWVLHRFILQFHRNQTIHWLRNLRIHFCAKNQRGYKAQPMDLLRPIHHSSWASCFGRAVGLQRPLDGRSLARQTGADEARCSFWAATVSRLISVICD